MTGRTVLTVPFSEFMAKVPQGIPFTGDQLLEMAVDQLNEGKPLVILTPKVEFVIPPESISEYLHPTPPEPPAAAEAPAALDVEPALPGESEAKPVV